MKKNSKKILFLIVSLGAILRFTNLNWDLFLGFHPDEPYISQAATRIRFFNQMDPQFYVYGGLPIYTERLTAEGIAKATSDQSWATQAEKIAVVGRYISACISTLSILLIFLVGKRFFSESVGLLSSFLLAVSPWAIREAHFAATESLLVGLLLILLLLAHKRHFFFLSAATGLAVAIKPTSYLFGIIPITAWLFSIQKRYLIAFKLATLMSIVAFITFFVTSPYTLFNYRLAGHQIRMTTIDILGLTGAYFTLQFTHTTPYLFQFKTMLWQAGLVPIFGIIGMAFLLICAIQKRDRSFFLFLSFPLAYGAWYGVWFTKFCRYNVLLLPFITVTASFLVANWIKRWPIVGRLMLIIITVTTLLWGLANWTIYLRPQTRILASQWIYKHIPPGSLILTEDANERMPFSVDGKTPTIYDQEILRVWDPETDSKIASLSSQLMRADYVIFATRREWAVIPQLTKRYPKTGQMYRKFLSGTLGYKEVATFQSYPSLFGIEINDDASEETNQIFDHPTVRIFKNISK